MVRRYQFVNNIIRLNYSSRLREQHIKRSSYTLKRPPENCKPSRVPIMTQKEALTEKVSKLLGQATYRDRMQAAAENN